MDSLDQALSNSTFFLFFLAYLNSQVKLLFQKMSQRGKKRKLFSYSTKISTWKCTYMICIKGCYKITKLIKEKQKVKAYVSSSCRGKFEGGDDLGLFVVNGRLPVRLCIIHHHHLVDIIIFFEVKSFLCVMWCSFQHWALIIVAFDQSL